VLYNGCFTCSGCSCMLAESTSAPTIRYVQTAGLTAKLPPPQHACSIEHLTCCSCSCACCVRRRGTTAGEKQTRHAQGGHRGTEQQQQQQQQQQTTQMRARARCRGSTKEQEDSSGAERKHTL